MLLNPDEFRFSEYSGRPFCKAGRLNQTISNNTLTALGLTTVNHNAWGMHSSGDNTKITIKVPGLYYVGLDCAWASDSTGGRYIAIRRNGTTTIGQDRRAALTTSEATTQVVRGYAGGDYVEAVVLQTSGGDLNVTSAGLTVFYITGTNP